MNIFKKIRAKMNANKLLDVCLNLIVKYEKMNPETKPSCIPDVRVQIKKRSPIVLLI